MSVLVRPVKTERSQTLAKDGKFTFLVVPMATKGQVRESVNRTFNVDVVSVHTTKLHGKTRRKGKRVIKMPDVKKAVVELKKGQTIDLFETEKKKGGRKRK